MIAPQPGGGGRQEIFLDSSRFLNAQVLLVTQT